MDRSIQWIFDAYLSEAVADEALRVAMAEVFAVPVNRVLVEIDIEPSRRACDVLVMRVTTAAPDDPGFPYTVRLFASGAVWDKVGLARRMSAALGMAMVADAAPAEREDDWLLVLPSGDIRTVRVDDDDAFLLSPSDLAAIAGARPTDRRAA